LFNGLLDISKLDASVTQVQLKDFELQPLLERLVNDFTPEAQQKRLKLVIPASPAQLHSDPRLLEQVLRNLMSNAVRHTPSGRVELVAQSLPSGWRIGVTDTGVGIAPEHQERVFDEFFQVGNTERDRNKGLGLGLSIVKRLANLLNLHLELHSVLGKGTTVYLHVPAARAARTPAPVSPIAQHRENLPGLRVLLVDDEAPIRQAMHMLLSLWQCDVRTLESLEHLMNMIADPAAADWAPDLIISDYRLQNGVHGTDVLDWAQRHWNTDIPALLLTGDTAPATLRHIEESGHRVVHKPVEPAVLHATILELLPEPWQPGRPS
jgi:two-component system, sensor histidine kinase